MIIGQSSGHISVRNNGYFVAPNKITVQIDNQNIFAETALTEVNSLDTEVDCSIGISQIVSENGTENFESNKVPTIFRKNVSSITFSILSREGLARGRWMIHYWS